MSNAIAHASVATEGRPASRRAAVLAWGLWSLVVAVIIGTIAGGAPDQTPGASGFIVLVVYFFFLLSFSTVGALIASRRPRHPIGWLLCGAAFAYALPSIGQIPARITPFLSQDVKDWIGGWAFGLGAGLAGSFMLLLFPDGRLPSRRWRPLAWVVGVGLAAFVLGQAFAPGHLEGDPTNVVNPFGVGGAVGQIFKAFQNGFFIVVVGIVASVVSIIVRFRRGGSVEREQLKWLVYATGLVVTAVVGNIVISTTMRDSAVSTDIQNAMVSGALACVPIAIGFAVMRYRLYDIDRIISRTLSYGFVVAFLGGLFALVVLLPTTIISSSNTPGWLVALATLVVFGLFRPVLRRVRSTVDRRFNRARFDAARTIESFTARLREQVDVDALGAELTDVVNQTMQPAHISVWLQRGPR